MFTGSVETRLGQTVGVTVTENTGTAADDEAGCEVMAVVAPEGPWNSWALPQSITCPSFRPNHATSAEASSSRSLADQACPPFSPWRNWVKLKRSAE